MSGLSEKLTPLAAAYDVAHEDTTSFGMAILNQNGQLEYAYREAEIIPAASFNKLSAVYALDREGIALSTEVQLEATDYRGGNGILQYAPEGYALTLGQAAELALQLSDNTALRVIMRALGGPARVNDTLSAPGVWRGRKGLNLEYTLFLPAQGQSIASYEEPTGAFTQGTTTPFESAHLLQWALSVPQFASALEHSNYGGGLRAKIDPLPPASLGRRFKEHLAKRTKNFDYLKAHCDYPLTAYPGKEGTIVDEEEELRHHAARIGNRVVSVMTESLPDPRSHKHPEQHHARVFQAEVGQLVRDWA